MSYQLLESARLGIVAVIAVTATEAAARDPT